ncbi:MAG: cupin domain-containing protein [Selenomonadaceae bacterium]|nr:cupin domain-containing protein [Selenomonadaceae bacterium]
MKISKFLTVAILSTSIFFTGTSFAAQPSQAESESILKELARIGGAVQPIGETNDTYAKYFTGQSYISNLSKDKNLPVFNVTFAHGAHTFWHIHHKSCQILVAAAGRGYYQIWGEEPQELLPGQTATIPAGVKHWHGAAPNSSFQHIALMQQVKGVTTEWLEPVDDSAFQKLK